MSGPGVNDPGVVIIISDSRGVYPAAPMISGVANASGTKMEVAREDHKMKPRIIDMRTWIYVSVVRPCGNRVVVALGPWLFVPPQAFAPGIVFLQLLIVEQSRLRASPQIIRF